MWWHFCFQQWHHEKNQRVLNPPSRFGLSLTGIYLEDHPTHRKWLVSQSPRIIPFTSGLQLHLPLKWDDPRASRNFHGVCRWSTAPLSLKNPLGPGTILRFCLGFLKQLRENSWFLDFLLEFCPQAPSRATTFSICSIRVFPQVSTLSRLTWGWWRGSRSYRWLESCHQGGISHNFSTPHVDTFDWWLYYDYPLVTCS